MTTDFASDPATVVVSAALGDNANYPTPSSPGLIKVYLTQHPTISQEIVFDYTIAVCTLTGLAFGQANHAVTYVINSGNIDVNVG